MDLEKLIEANFYGLLSHTLFPNDVKIKKTYDNIFNKIKITVDKKEKQDIK